jgi:hypothetical protein
MVRIRIVNVNGIPVPVPVAVWLEARALAASGLTSDAIAQREDRAWLIVCAVGPRMTDVVVLTDHVGVRAEFGRADEPSLDPVGRGAATSHRPPTPTPGPR